MNCINHPETPVEAFCQQCGKALCSQCVRTVGGVVFCEACLAARLGIPPAGTTAKGSYTVNVSDPNFQYSATGPLPVSGPYSGDARPGLAGFLGVIPGVGAMYNGQFLKALVHVLAFVILIGITNDDHPIFGIFIAAWIFYQIFDAFQTAKARRDGLPLPDPFGLNDLGARLGLHPAQPATVPPGAPGVANPVYPPPGAAQAAYEPAAYTAAAGYGPPPSTAADYGAPVQPGTPISPYPPLPPQRSEPVGAIVLIGLGVLFLCSSLGVFNFDWLHRSWPIFLIILGGWLIFRRTRDLPGGGAK